jgi:hypothetical protein
MHYLLNYPIWCLLSHVLPANLRARRKAGCLRSGKTGGMCTSGQEAAAWVIDKLIISGSHTNYSSLHIELPTYLASIRGARIFIRIGSRGEARNDEKHQTSTW